MLILKLCKKYLLLVTISSAFFIAGCASYTENGELVRHHFGYVKVITPAVHAPGNNGDVYDFMRFIEIFM